MKTILTMLLMILSAALAAQTNPNVIWSKVYGGSSSDFGNKLIDLSNGEFICIGSSSSTDLLFDCNHGGSDGTIFKIDLNGNLINKICLGGTDDDEVYDIINYSDSEIYVCGRVKSIDGDFSNNHGIYDGVLVKLDTNLNVKWIRTYGGTQWESIDNIIKLPNGNLAMIGQESSNDYDLQNALQHGVGGIWFLIVDSAGNIISNQTFGGTESVGWYDNLVLIDSTQILLVASFKNIGFPYQLNLIQMDLAGNINWQRSYGNGSGIQNGIDLCSDSLKNIYVLTACTDNDPLITNYHGNNFADIAIIKFDSSGNEIWGKCYGGSLQEWAKNIFYKNNHLFVSGESRSSDGDLPLNKGIDDVWLFEVSTDGIIENSQVFGGSLNDYSSELISTPDNNFIFIGTSGSPDIDVNNSSALPPFNIWVCKIKKEALGINWSDNNSNVKVFPNPSHGSFTVSGLPETSKSITISNILGQVIYSNLNTNEKTIEINLPDIETGIYFLKIISQELNFTEKIMKL